MFKCPLLKAGYVEIPNPEFQGYLDMLTTNDIKKVAREQAARNFDSVLSLLCGKPGDFNSMIERFYKIFSKYSGWFTFAYTVTGKNGLVLSFRHTKGIKWSIFLAEYNRVVLEKFCSKTSMQTLDNEVIFDVVLNQD
ncbi:MAG: hypothetical protein ACREBI_01980 [Nitrosotalea sp.]